MDMSPILEASGMCLPINAADSDWEDWLHAQYRPPPVAKKRRANFAVLRRQFATLTCALLQLTCHLTVEFTDEILSLVHMHLQEDYFDFIDQDKVIVKFEALCVRLWLERLSLCMDITHMKTGRLEGADFKNK